MGEMPFRYLDYIRNIAPEGLSEGQLSELAFWGGVSDIDDATAVIRGTSHLEAMVLLLIHRNLERWQLIDGESLGFSRRILWAKAMGELTDDMADALRALARIRNKLAHNHTQLYAPVKLINPFLAAVGKLPRNDAITLPVPDAIKHEMTLKRWRMRMGITVLNNHLYMQVVAPPPRTRVPRATHMDIALVQLAGLDPMRMR